MAPRDVLIILNVPGDKMGWGGELVTAQFLLTEVLDASTLRYTSKGSNSSERLGLFIDARCKQGAMLMKRVIENDQITKYGPVRSDSPQKYR
jgi:hypothetical protein